MGVIESILSLVFGGGRNAIKDTVEVFRENAEAGAVRAHDMRGATLRQFAAEFAVPRKGRFDRFIDGLNRVPRPAMALGVLGLMVAAMTDPIWLPAGCRVSPWCQSRFGGCLGRLSAFTSGRGIRPKGRISNALSPRQWQMRQR